MKISKFPSYFTKAMKLCYILREDIHSHFPKKTLLSEKHNYFAMWWLTIGKREYPDHFRLTRPLILHANQKVKTCFDYPISRFMLFVLKTRKDINKLFSTKNINDTRKFLVWFYTHGLKEYKLTELMTEERKTELAAPYFKNSSCTFFFPISKLMHLIWSQRKDLQDITSLKSVNDNNWYIKWFYIQGCNELDLYHCVSPEEIRRLNKPVQNITQSTDSKITYLMYLLWSYIPEINNSFDLNNEDGKIKYFQWFNMHGVFEYNLDKLLISGAPHKEGLSREITCKENTNCKKKEIAIEFGVNLVGYATGDLGIGEDVRMMVNCLQKTDIPFCVINKKPGKEISQRDRSIIQYISDVPKYAITIICMTGVETMGLFFQYPQLFHSYVIGYWPWELPKWPNKWHAAFSLVNEIWASSKYTQSAYSEAPVPVKYMPMAVSIERLTKKYSRKDFGLPKGNFLFLFVFDFMSYMERKNPYASIEAFKSAFPKGTEKVSLILKISNIQKKSKKWQEFKKRCKSDKRIILIDLTYSRKKILGLFSVCDAYISLHRAEGFGRTMAEALMLGKPVIATNFSGNVDFLNEENGYPVKYELRKLNKGDYPGHKAQYWADPSIKNASEILKFIYNNEPNTGRLSSRYSVSACSEAYRDRLTKLGKEL